MKNHLNFFKKQAPFFIILCVLFSSAAYADDSAVPRLSHRGVNMTVDSNDLGDVCGRVLREPGSLCGQEHVARCGRPTKVARQRDDDDRRQPAGVERVALDNHYWSTEAGPRPGGIGKRRPDDIALADYHSLRSSAPRPASATHPSTSGPISSTSSSRATVTASGSRRATYSASASR